MKRKTKTYLLVGGLGVVGLLIYEKLNASAAGGGTSGLLPGMYGGFYEPTSTGGLPSSTGTQPTWGTGEYYGA